MRDLARAAILEVADLREHVGDFVGEDGADDVLIVRFTSLHPGYPGWRWCAALVRSGSGATVNEVWMEPGEGSLPVPVWKPWSERIRPGDLGAGDVVATDPTDARITAGYTAEDALEDELQLLPAQWQIGLGRARVLSVEGLADAAERWRGGEDGPDSQVARLAEFPCSTCAWLLPIGGLLGQAFGVCAHDMSPSDGHVVSMDHGCGAHSDVLVDTSPIPVTDMLIDEHRFIAVSREDGVESAPAVDSATDVADDELAGEHWSDDGGPEFDESALESLASAQDVTDSDDTDDDPGHGDATPPEDVVLLEEIAEDEAEQGE